MLPVVCGGSVFVFVLICITLCPIWFCSRLGERRVLDALLLFSYGCLVTVNVM